MTAGERGPRLQGGEISRWDASTQREGGSEGRCNGKTESTGLGLV